MEAAWCWVCRRSTTSCASCRHFRTSVAGRLSYCGLDKGRTPLTGEEERACWERKATEAGSDEPAGEIATAAARIGDLWSVPAAAKAPDDTEAQVPGIWTEADSTRSAEAAAHQHGGSIRSKPWGPVPGLREPTGWRRGIRAVTRKG